MLDLLEHRLNLVPDVYVDNSLFESLRWAGADDEPSHEDQGEEVTQALLPTAG